MKKYFLFLVISLLLFTGCSLSKPSVNNPYEIVKGKSKLSYYDTEDNIDIDGFDVSENSVQNFLNENNNIIVNKDGMIRCINISDKDVITYKQISVGDDVNKIKKAFNYERKIGNDYNVIFNENTEEDPTNENQEESWTSIFYITDGSKITGIQISDVKYRRTLF